MKEEEMKKGEPIQAKLVEIPTQTVKAIQLPDESVVSIEEMLVVIYNEIRSLRKSIG